MAIFLTALITLVAISVVAIFPYWRRIKDWLLEEDADPNLGAYAIVNDLIDRTIQKINSATEILKQELKVISENSTKDYKEQTDELLEQMKAVIQEFRDACTQLEPYISKKSESPQINSISMDQIRELLEYFEENTSEDSKTMGVDCISEVKNSAQELQNIFSQLLEFEGEDDSPYACLESFSEAIELEKENLTLISQTLGTDSLTREYAKEATKVKPRLLALIVSLLASGYLTANAIIFARYPPESLWEVIGKISITAPIALLMYIAARRYWEALRHRELYGHKRNMTATYYAFLSHAEASSQNFEELRERLIKSLVDALSINPAEMMKKSSHYRADTKINPQRSDFGIQSDSNP